MYFECFFTDGEVETSGSGSASGSASGSGSGFSGDDDDSKGDVPTEEPGTWEGKAWKLPLLIILIVLLVCAILAFLLVWVFIILKTRFNK